MSKCRPHQHTGRKSARILPFLLLLSACFFACQFAPELGADDPMHSEQSGVLLPPASEFPTANESTSATEGKLPPADDPPPAAQNMYSPLTGLPVDDALATSRPLAVCIGNTSAGFPQYGVGDAEILFEAPVEGGSTRLMLMTCNYANIPCFGSVRSTRDYLITLAKSFDAISAFAGTADVKESAPYNTGDSLDYISQNMKETFFRDTKRQSPHNLMTSGKLLSLSIEDCGYRTQIGASSLPYGIASSPANATKGTKSATRIELPFSSIHKVLFTYDADGGRYVRYQNGTAHTDGYTQKQLSFTNLIVLSVDSVAKNNAYGEPTLSIDTESGGEGIYIHNGKAVDINWQNQNGKLVFKDKQGAALTVAPGKTYIALYRNASLLPYRVE